ncbi:hypothetical protein ACQ5SK_15485 [Bradyrhizobium japonicum]
MPLGAFDSGRNVGGPAGGRGNDVGDRFDRGLCAARLGLGWQRKRRVMAGKQARMRMV